MRSSRRRGLVVIIAALVALPGGAVALARNFEAPASTIPYQQYAPASVQRQDTPNDPNYDNAEPDTQNARTATDLSQHLPKLSSSSS